MTDDVELSKDRLAMDLSNEELIAIAFHETYERLAPQFGYKTREATAKVWEEVPGSNRKLMIAVVKELLDNGIIYD